MKVTEDTMCKLLKKSGVQATDWLVMAKELQLNSLTLVGIFLEAWKKCSTKVNAPSWPKLATALEAISDGGMEYEYSIMQAKKNAGRSSSQCS